MELSNRKLPRYRRATQIWGAPRIRVRSAFRCSRPAAWVSYPGGPGWDCAAGFDQCEEKDVSPPNKTRLRKLSCGENRDFRLSVKTSNLCGARLRSAVGDLNSGRLYRLRKKAKNCHFERRF